MRRLYLTVGCPASGKSSWAKDFVSKNSNTLRVNRDDFRMMLNNYAFNQNIEGIVLKLRDEAIVSSLKNGFDVIVDETSINKKVWNQILKLISDNHIDCEIIEKSFYTPLEELLERNSKRSLVIPEDVIKMMWKNSGKESFKNYEDRNIKLTFNSDLSKTLNDPSLPKCIIVDLDGTISLFNNKTKEHENTHFRSPYDASRAEYDTPNQPVVSCVNSFYNEGYKIFFCSAREEKFRPQTEKFLNNNINSNVKYELLMRANDDERKDCIIKEEILRLNIAGKYSIYVALDDRNQVVNYYRNILKLNVFQVNNGDF